MQLFNPRRFRSHGLRCRYSQVQEPNHAQLVLKIAQKWHQETQVFLNKEAYPKFQRSTHFAKKHKKSLKEVQANDAKVVSTHAEAIKPLLKPKEVKPKIPKCSSRKLILLACVAHPKLRKHTQACITKGPGSGGQRPRPRLRPSPRLQQQLRLRLQKGPRSLQRFHNRGL